jgi:DNA polymerase-3 subunit delta'
MWHGVLGHDPIVEHFRHALKQRRLASSFLFCGSGGIGKRTFALKLAQSLLCQQRAEELLEPCETCPSCQQVRAGSHPDLVLVSKPAEKSELPVDLLIGDREHRMREGLIHDLSLRPLMGGRKIAIVDDADYLNAEGANCLLKTLEEPPPQSVLILIGTSPAKQLPTIRSRCQLVRFRPLPAATVAELLLAQELVSNAELAQRLAIYSEGSLDRARQLADEPLWQFRTQLFRHLAEPLLDSVNFAKTVAALVDEAGRDAAPRRQRLRQIVQLALDFYREVMRLGHGAASGPDPELDAHARQALAVQPGASMSSQRCLERCLEAAGQIDRNANQATLIESWLDELAEIGRTTRMAATR